MSKPEYKKVGGMFRGVVISVGSLSGKRPIVMQEVAKHEFEAYVNLAKILVKIPLHWFYPKMLKNETKGRRPIFVKMHFYGKYLKTIIETSKPDKEILVRVKVSQKFRDKKVSDIIMDVYPEKHGTEAKFDLVFTRTNGRGITVPHALEKIYFKSRSKG